MTVSTPQSPLILEVPNNWATANIGDFLVFEYGKGLTKTARDASGEVPVYGSSGIAGYHTEPLTNEPCLIVGRKGAAGAVHISRVPAWPIDTAYFVRAPNGFDLSFLYYLLNTAHLDHLDKSTAIPSLSRDDAYAVQVRFPPTNEQKRIVEKLEQLLSELDKAVDSLKAAQEKLKTYRRAVLKAAVEGELSRAWREENRERLEPADKLLEHILAERRRKWEEAELEKMWAKGLKPKDDRWKEKYKEPAAVDSRGLPDVPAGWLWASIGQVATSIVDCLHSTPNFQAEGFACVDTNCIKPGGIVLEKVRFVDEKTYQDRNRRMVPKPGDVLFSREGALLGIAVSVPESFNLCLGQRMMVFRLSINTDSYFFESFLNSDTFKSQYKSKILGTASPHLNIRDIRLMGIPIASTQEQGWITSQLGEKLSIIENLTSSIAGQLAYSKRLRESILQKAFSGQLVPQDPNDEPASVLLERIRAERAAQGAGGKHGKKKTAETAQPWLLEVDA